MCTSLFVPQLHLFADKRLVRLNCYISLKCELLNCSLLTVLVLPLTMQLLYCRKQDSSIGPMSSDSLLPLFIVALIVAQPLHLHACLDYVRRFHLNGDWAGQTGFQVISLPQ